MRMNFFGWILGGIKDFIVGMVSEFFNWLVDVVVEIAERLAGLLEQILIVFNFIPQTARYFDRLIRAVFFFAPDIVFSILYTVLAVVGIILFIKFFLKLLGSG